jgi:ribosomal protein L16 Arg81 hydroxylase
MDTPPATPARAERLDFESLIAPVRLEEFFSDHWERRPLHVARGDASRYGSLVKPADLEKLASAALDAEGARVETLGDPGEAAGTVGSVVDAESLEAARARGATFRLMGMQCFWGPAATLARRLEQRFSCPVALNLYATPPDAQGAQRHYDNHDVLVLQIEGRKLWRVYEPLVPLPLASVPPLPFEERTEELKYARGGPRKGRADIGDRDAGAPAHEFTLEAGDALYLPRGFVHEARALGESSVHVTVGFHVLTWLDLLTVALGQTAQRDERFRAALPLGLLDAHTTPNALAEKFRALLEDLARVARLDDALSEVAESFVRSRAGSDAEPNGGEPRGYDDATAVDLDTTLERRPGLLCRLLEGPDSTGLAFARQVIWMPRPFRDALAFVARTETLRPRDIPGVSGEAGRLALARRLVRDGLLRIR